MYTIKTFVDQSLNMYQLHNEKTKSWFTVCPERGGIITEFGVGGKEQLYLDQETLFNKRKSIHGGIPILFPIAGKLADDKYTWDGHTYEMANHGFARNYRGKLRK